MTWEEQKSEPDVEMALPSDVETAVAIAKPMELALNYGPGVVFIVTEVGSNEETVRTSASIRSLRIEMAIEAEVLYPCVQFYTRCERTLEVRDSMDIEDMQQPIGLFFMNGEEDIMPYLVEAWAAREWFDALEQHIHYGDAGAVDRVKPWVMGFGGKVKERMEEMYRDMVKSKSTEDGENIGRIMIMARLGINPMVIASSASSSSSTSRKNQSLLHIAAASGRADLVASLLAAMVDVNAYLCQDLASPPLHLAAEHGHIGVVELLLTANTNNMGCNNLNVSQINNDLSLAVCTTTTTATSSVSSNRQLFFPHAHGRSPLHKASEKGHSQIVRMLVEADADIHQVDNDGCTSLYLALSSAIRDKRKNRKYMETIQTLIHAHADVNEAPMEKHVLHEAIRRKRNPSDGLMRILLDARADANKCDHLGSTPLCLAAREGPNAIPLLRALVKARADVNLAEKGRGFLCETGDYPLHAAARRGHADVIQVLIRELGATVNVSNCLDDTPAEVAAGLAQKALRDIVRETTDGSESS